MLPTAGRRNTLYKDRGSLPNKQHSCEMYKSIYRLASAVKPLKNRFSNSFTSLQQHDVQPVDL